jgi:predicted phosphodiesterase
MPARPHPVSRRAFLGTLGSALAVAGLGGCKSAAARPPATFRFLVVNDLHHGSAECDPFFAQLIAQMRGHGPVEFCLVVGDLADKGRPESLRAIRDAFAKLNTPMYCVPGNHDCDVEQNTRLYSEVFPDRLNYHFAHEGWQFIALDSTHGNNWGDTQIQPATLAWLDQTLPRLQRTKPTVVFTHFPLAPVANARLTPTNAAEVVARFDGWNLRGALTGHYHARTETPHGASGGILLTNACCARMRDNHDRTIPEGYLVCTAHPDGAMEREFVRFTPAELSAAAAEVGTAR